MIEHTSVLREEAVQALNPTYGKTYIDGTLGGGGHAKHLCNLLDATSTLIGIDQDPVALAQAQEKLANCPPTLKLVQGNFGNLLTLLLQVGLPKIDGGILLDLGVSDFQIKHPERGFSFLHAAPLDMRMDPNGPQTAADLVNTLPAKDLANLFYQYADEKLSRSIASAIVNARPIENTLALAKIAENIYRQKGIKAQKIHPATRIFQALRIAVNQELQMLESCLNQLPNILLPGAHVAIITFHSIEDRMVKQFFRVACAPCICPPQQPICTCQHQATFKAMGKPIVPTDQEVQDNPQSRSAKLRVYERI